MLRFKLTILNKNLNSLNFPAAIDLQAPQTSNEPYESIDIQKSIGWPVYNNNRANWE